MEPIARERIAEELEGLTALDQVAAPVQATLRKAVPQGTRAKDALSGTWLGHPLHPPLTDVVIGAWTSALALDLVGGEDARPAADTLVGLGIVAAVPTAAAGASDWAELLDAERRVGLVHALGNTTALLLQVASWRSRRSGHRGRGVGLSTVAFGVATVSAWLGGHLSYGRGVGVNQTAFEEGPDEWAGALPEAELRDRTLTHASVHGLGVLLVRLDGRVHAIADRCSHRGCSLHEGELVGDAVECGCHGSRFRLADGTIVQGPATAPQPVFEVRSHGGTVEIRRPREP
jgi:nitrite reductase/ring-hydroxylating ferredoxin subunit/uncharacterized membrane protein